MKEGTETPIHSATGRSLHDSPPSPRGSRPSSVLVYLHTGRIPRSVWILAIAEWRDGPGYELTHAQGGEATTAHAVGDDRALVLCDRSADLDDEHVPWVAG